MKDKLYKHKLIRIGSANDGGYFVCPNSILNSKNLISLGVETNWEFEKGFIKSNPKIIVTCYDGQILLHIILMIDGVICIRGIRLAKTNYGNE